MKVVFLYCDTDMYKRNLLKNQHTEKHNALLLGNRLVKLFSLADKQFQ